MLSATDPRHWPKLAHRGKAGIDDQLLEPHLFGTARLARRYAGCWGGDCAFTVGLWHDLGKYQAAFQTYLRAYGPRGSVTHSTAGALHLLEQIKTHHANVDRIGRIPKAAVAMMMAILAHHGKLPDRAAFESRLGLAAPGEFFPGKAEYAGTLDGNPLASILEHDALHDLGSTRSEHPLLARMLLSALVDADVVNSSGRKSARLKSIASLNASFSRGIGKLAKNSQKTEINSLRGEVLEACLAKAGSPRNCFRLDAPTGFAKTFSSLGFALEHARQNGMDRVIYVAPFLTAMEQTATEFRRILNVMQENRNLGQFTVLECHSTAERDAERVSGGSSSVPVADYDDDAEEAASERTPSGQDARNLLRENWEARVIVTSNVQFFESLHAHDRGRCRKLHRIANAVILIDEPQSIPIRFYAPTIDTLKEIVASYSSSIVFITATQPAFEFSKSFAQGLHHIESILSDELLDRLRRVAAARVNVTLPSGWLEMSVDEIANDVAQQQQSTLCILNTRKDAAAVFQEVKTRAVDPNTVYHLSAAMCSDHRTSVLKKIRAQLDPNNPDRKAIKLISTQVVEAGIDISFPVVMRAMAGLDSLIQSAGRCNRHGLPTIGEFKVFLLSGGVPHMFRTVAGITQSLLEDGCGLFDPATAQSFYKRIRDVSDKGSKLLEQQRGWNMTAVGTEYRLIEPTLTVVVPYCDYGSDRCRRLLSMGDDTPRRSKKDEPFAGLNGITVSIHEKARDLLISQGFARDIGDFGLLVVLPDAGSPYDATLGLQLPQADPVQ